jgi:methylenetetrahydrofolate reductase (NADPH)
MPYEPTELLTELATQKAQHPDLGIRQVHFFPLGGIKNNANWVTENGGAAGRPASAE